MVKQIQKSKNQWMVIVERQQYILGTNFFKNSVSEWGDSHNVFIVEKVNAKIIH